MNDTAFGIFVVVAGCLIYLTYVGEALVRAGLLGCGCMGAVMQ